MVLLREELGDVLRDTRHARGRTLREVSEESAVSLGYISEIERGEKEASSELLNSICEALDLPLSEVLAELSQRARLAEEASAPVALPVRSARTVAASAA